MSLTLQRITSIIYYICGYYYTICFRILGASMRGFSLVELSIVLVILGLLTGGILAGQSLIRAAEIRSVSTEVQRYVAASQSFRDKYMALPGDMRQATRFWNRQVNAAHCATNVTPAVAVASPGVCDGNGDGAVAAATYTAGSSAEDLQFWRQLGLAGMIEGSYTGVANASGNVALGSERPLSKISRSGYYINNAPNFVGDSTAYALDYGTFFEFYSEGTPPLSPEEAWNIDSKMDDGKPASGKVVARYWNNLCSAADDGTHAFNDLVASYRVSDSSKQCNLIFRQLF